MSDIIQSTSSAADPRMMMLYDANKKSAGVAYLLWFFVGLVGGHRFYLGRTGSGVGLAILSVVSTLLTVVLIGAFGLIVACIWVFVDAFLIPGMVQEQNNQLIRKLGA